MYHIFKSIENSYIHLYFFSCFFFFCLSGGAASESNKGLLDGSKGENEQSLVALTLLLLGRLFYYLFYYRLTLVGCIFWRIRCCSGFFGFFFLIIIHFSNFFGTQRVRLILQRALLNENDIREDCVDFDYCARCKIDILRSFGWC